jgi:DNA-binding transcriptional ArsR family regulator
MGASPPLDEAFIKALAHPLRWRLIEALVERGEASPVELARLLEQPLATVSHHIRVLRDLGSIELTRTEQRRGAIEHYYRTRMPAFVDDEQWEQIPTVLRRGISGQLFQRIMSEAAAAGGNGAFDAPGSHLDRMIIELDDRGWQQLSDVLLDLLRRIQAIQGESDARRDGKTHIRVSEIVLMHFEVAESLALADADADADRGGLPERSPPIP